MRLALKFKVVRSLGGPSGRTPVTEVHLMNATQSLGVVAEGQDNAQSVGQPPAGPNRPLRDLSPADQAWTVADAKALGELLETLPPSLASLGVSNADLNWARYRQPRQGNQSTGNQPQGGP